MTSVVTSDLRLSSALASTPRELSREEKARVKEDALDVLATHDPLLPHIMDVSGGAQSEGRGLGLGKRRVVSERVM